MKPVSEFTIEDLLIQKMYVVAVDTTKEFIRLMGFEWSDFNNLTIINKVLNFLGANLLFQEFAYPMRYVKTYGNFCIDYLMACIGNPSLQEEGVGELFDSLVKAAAENIPEYLRLLDNGVSDLGDNKHDNEYTDFVNCFLAKFTIDDKENLMKMTVSYLNKVNERMFNYNDSAIREHFSKDYLSFKS